MNSEPNKPELLPFPMYADHRNGLVQTLQKQAEAFDKAILTLSSGALAISLLFVEKVAPDPVAWTKIPLILAWGLFTTSMLCTLLSFLTSQASHAALIDEWDRTRETQRDPADHKERDKHDRRTRILNAGAALTFIGGVVFLLLFACANFLENDMGKKAKVEQKGFPATPNPTVSMPGIPDRVTAGFRAVSNPQISSPAVVTPAGGNAGTTASQASPATSTPSNSAGSGGDKK